MKRVLQIASASIVSISMMAGVAAADINTTGPGSSNQINNNSTNNINTTNNTTCTVSNTNSQAASSGSANTSGNTSAGSSTSGNASNGNRTSSSCTVNGVSFPTTNAAQKAVAAQALAAAQTAGKADGKGGAQVAAPTGSVHAGAGGAPSSVSLASILGVIASVGTLGLGVALRKKAFQS